MDPNLIVGAALTAVDEIITLIKHIRGQAALTDDQLLAQAQAQDLQNLEDIKKLLAL
jgi:hypothetical protein